MTPPRLLISVRSIEEAVAALAGGCDILDIKEPTRGSLGKADDTTIAAICQTAREVSQQTPISVALGETARQTTIPVVPHGVTYVKLGLSGLRHRIDWQQRWQEVRDRVENAAERRLSWIAVIYADDAAEAPPADAILATASATGCRGVLVDTFDKNAGRLLDHVTSEELARWRSTASASDLMFGIAGSLRIEDLSILDEVQPDVVAVRGAACQDGRRDGDVSSQAVVQLRERLQSLAFHSDPR